MAEQIVPSSYDIESARLGAEGGYTEIAGLIIELSVYASIMDTTNVMRLVVMDSRNVLTNLPIQGGIPLTVDLKLNGELRTYKLVLTKVGAIQDMTNQRAYVLEGISELAFVSQFAKISKSYSGAYNEIALQVFKEHTTEKFGIFDGSLGTKTVVVPNWSPLKTLKWLASKARDEDRDVRFRFFQDSKGLYNFMPIERLIDIYKDKPADEFSYNAANSRTNTSVIDMPNTQKDMKNILAIDYKDSFDITRALRDGFLFGRNYNIDLENKNTEIVDYNYFDNHKKDDYLNEGFFYPYNQYTPGIIRVNTDNEDIDISQIKRSSVNGYNQAISINVHGNQDIDIAQVLKINIPDPSAESQNGQLDSVYSGLYYVVGKRDTFRENQFMTSLDLVKDGM